MTVERERKPKPPRNLGIGRLLSSPSVNLADEVRRCHSSRLCQVQEMRRQKEKSPIAHSVRGITVHLGLVMRKVGDAAQVLKVLGVTEEDDPLGLLLDYRGQAPSGARHDSSALAI